MHQRHSGNHDACILKPFEPERDVNSRLDVPMVLLAQVVQVLGGAKLRVAGPTRQCFGRRVETHTSFARLPVMLLFPAA
jgi:hypothetical protein